MLLIILLMLLSSQVIGLIIKSWQLTQDGVITLVHLVLEKLKLETLQMIEILQH